MLNTPTSEPQPQSAANETPVAQKTQDSAICIRSVKTSFVLGFAVLLLCLASHHYNWAWGFLIGGCLSLFSLVTLMLSVPFLTWSGAPRHMSALLVVALLMKLPIFCLALYMATRLPGVSAFACFFGICLAPAVITLKAVNTLLIDMLPVHEPKTAAIPQTEETTAALNVAQTPETVKPLRKVSPQLASEQG